MVPQFIPDPSFVAPMETVPMDMPVPPMEQAEDLVPPENTIPPEPDLTGAFESPEQLSEWAEPVSDVPESTDNLNP